MHGDLELEPHIRCSLNFVAHYGSSSATLRQKIFVVVTWQKVGRDACWI
jgi:hypothetical protein